MRHLFLAIIICFATAYVLWLNVDRANIDNDFVEYSFDGEIYFTCGVAKTDECGINLKYCSDGNDYVCVTNIAKRKREE